MTTTQRIKSQRKHDAKQAIINLIEYTIAMLICILFTMINDTNIDNFLK